MSSLIRAFDKITLVMHWIGGVFLIGMMVATLADVLSRGLFGMTDGAVDWTFIGGVELVKYSLLFTVLFILPHSVSRSQVIVDLFTEGLSQRRKDWLEALYLLCFGLLGVGMCYSFFHLMVESDLYYETTQDLLIPMSYFYAVASFATAMLALSAALQALALITNKKG
ncbi:TRAP transporter small permease [Maribrevibacterium harenarium]|uniref:TRAP transporter small permease protein n=1 Tax=Maribrevibacterium harenarium TaxID=2589817 RepID=A0A501X1L1_9GAMM|nr:TRAP transporter small permease subunit [Maribrevibacterium harenarium]TPE54361.1 TRAP transporter small permease [Maribrevibacterium harenarium]